MIRTVESLKKQHQLLTHAILQQNGDVNMESSESIKALNLSAVKINEEKSPSPTTQFSVPSLKLNFSLSRPQQQQQQSNDEMEE